MTLYRGADAGGHVKAWEHLAEGAVEQPGLDLTVYFLGDRPRTESLGPATRYVMLPPRLGTDRFPFLHQAAGDTDLALHHGPLARRIRRHDLLHATDTFAFGRTARLTARRGHTPLVFSLHTHLPRFTRVYSREIIARVLGQGLAGRLGLDTLVLDRLHLDERAARVAGRAVERIMRASRAVLVSNDRDRAWAADVVPPDRVHDLRRGIDSELFHPRRRDPAGFRDRWGIPDRPLVLFAGRVDDTKGVMRVARALQALRGDGVDAQMVVAGEGDRVPDLRALLDDRVSCLGTLSQAELAVAYASSDVFAFPSRTETVGNVVIEALASGLPAVVTAGTACAERVSPAGEVGPVPAGVVVRESTDDAWAAAIRSLLQAPDRRRTARLAARRRIESGWPTWADVVRDDLLPVWRAAVTSG